MSLFSVIFIYFRCQENIFAGKNTQRDITRELCQEDEIICVRTVPIKRMDETNFERVIVETNSRKENEEINFERAVVGINFEETKTGETNFEKTK